MNPRADPAGDDTVGLFDRVYQDYSRPLYAYLRCRAGDEAAEDLLQEVFLRVWSHLDDLRALPEDRQAPWLFTIARNVARDHHRRRTVAERYRVALEQQAPQTDPTSDPVTVLEGRETARAVDEAIAGLPADLREALSLHVAAGWTSAQIGRALGRPAGTVRWQISQARRRIASALGLMPTDERGSRR